MELYFILTGLGFFLFLIGVTALIWMVRSGQVDDLDTPALRMLNDDEPNPQNHREERPNERR